MSLGSILKEMIAPVTDLVGKAVVDKDKVREIQYKMEELADQADERYHEEIMGQLAINQEEAKHASVFVAGWRPSIGWVGSLSLFMYYPVQIAVQLWNTGTVDMNLGDLMILLTGILGMGTIRSYDKKQDTDTKRVG